MLRATAEKAGAPGRVISLASSAHFGPYSPQPLRADGEIDSPTGYSPWPAYGQSKLCNVLLARELQRRWSEARAPLVAVACHPGVIPTSDLFRHVKLFPRVVQDWLQYFMTPLFKVRGWVCVCCCV